MNLQDIISKTIKDNDKPIGFDVFFLPGLSLGCELVLSVAGFGGIISAHNTQCQTVVSLRLPSH